MTKRLKMKDFTVYSKYSTFVNQLKDDYTKVVVRPIPKNNLAVQLGNFTADLYKKCYTTNDEEMAIRYNDSVVALIYVPCVDQYQKQYIVCVTYVSVLDNKIISKQCYKESVNPLCISNANIKDILAELKNIDACVKDEDDRI
jgi:hypothetical protein